MASILIIEDEHALGSALAMAVRRIGHLPTLAASGAKALECIERETFGAVVLDIGLPDMSGIEVLEKIRGAGSQVPVLVVTAHATLDHAIASRKLGIAEYLMKPLDLRRFEEAVTSLLTAGIHVDGPPLPAATTLIGTAPAMHRVFLGIARACCGDMPVLIHGPGGSGKSLAAQVIHNNSTHGTGALRRIECRARDDASVLREHLRETTGTLVLENIDQLDPAHQSLLAETITGGEPLPRLVATLTEDRDDATARQLLMGGLFYAFSALAIEMPPLRERAGDIPALSRFFHGLSEDATQSLEITAPALCALQAYAWPGNVRELHHVLAHAWAISRGGPMRPGHLPPHVAEALHTSRGSVANGELDVVLARWIDSQLEIIPEAEWQYDAMLEKIETSLLGHLMKRFEGRPTRLAAALRMNRATLRKKLRNAGIVESA